MPSLRYQLFLALGRALSKGINRIGDETREFSLPQLRAARVSQEMLGQRRAIKVEPAVNSRGRMLYLHGGAYVAGTAQHGIQTFWRIARHNQLTLWSLDYSLAKEARFPTAVEEVQAACEILLARGEGPLIVAGESAGAGLALAATLALRDSGRTMPDALVLLYPWCDLTLSGQSIKENTGRDLLRESLLADAASRYSDSRIADPLASPLFANLAGLPPSFIQVGDRDLLLDDARRLHKRLIDAGNKSKLSVWPDMVHAFTLSTRFFPEARAAEYEAAQAIASLCPQLKRWPARAEEWHS